MFEERVEKKGKAEPEVEVHPTAIGLLASCEASRDWYREQGMEIEAGVFEAYIERIKTDFRVPSSPQGLEKSER